LIDRAALSFLPTATALGDAAHRAASATAATAAAPATTTATTTSAGTPVVATSWAATARRR